MTCYADLSIDEALADPMIRLVMSADHVEPRALETTLRAAAKRIDGNALRYSPEPDSSWRSLVDYCHVWAQPPANALTRAGRAARDLCGAPCAW